jgi:hypothetical protein
MCGKPGKGRHGTSHHAKAAVMKTFVTDISASTGRNDFIFDIWLLHGELYHVSPFQVYCTSTSCLLCDLEFFMLDICNESFHYGKNEKF